MMTMYSSYLNLPKIEQPEWIKEERYMYCDQFYHDLCTSGTNTIWKRIKKFFGK